MQPIGLLPPPLSGQAIVAISSNTGRVNSRIRRDIEGKMWFGVVSNVADHLPLWSVSGIAVKCKALLDVPFHPTISRATKGTTLKTRKTILNNPRNE